MVDYRDRLAAAMQRAGVDRNALAKHLEVTPQAVQKVLDGKSNCLNAVNHAKAALYLGIDPDWLALDVGSMVIPERRLSAPAMLVALALDAISDERIKAEIAALLERLLAKNAERLRELWPIGRPSVAPALPTETPPELPPSVPLAKRRTQRTPPDRGGR